MAKPLVGIIMGSDSDYPVMEAACDILYQLSIPYEVLVASAHRTPKRTQIYIRGVRKKGIRIIIAGAGAAAHLPGVLAAETTLPVIGVPINSSSLNGLDSLLAICQMPGGIPVATMAIGKAGAKNAGLLAAQILAVGDSKMSIKLQRHRDKMAREVEAKDKKLQAVHGKNYPNST